MILYRLRGINVGHIIVIKGLQKECLFKKLNKGRETIIYKEIMLWFFHDPKKKFEKELYKYWNSEIDFKLVENKLLVHLYESKKNYFMLPASKTKNKLIWHK